MVNGKEIGMGLACPGAASAWYICSSMPAASKHSAISWRTVDSTEPEGNLEDTDQSALFTVTSLGEVADRRMNSDSKPTRKETSAVALASSVMRLRMERGQNGTARPNWGVGSFSWKKPRMEACPGA